MIYSKINDSVAIVSTNSSTITMYVNIVFIGNLQSGLNSTHVNNYPLQSYEVTYPQRPYTLDHVATYACIGAELLNLIP